jgi:conjugative transposon TraN protein
MNYKLFLLSLIAVIAMATPAFAETKSVKNTDNNVSSDMEQVATQVAEHEINVYGGNYTYGDKFDGLTRKVGFDRMIPPHALEVCFEKTTHIIFPSEIVYCDLGNENLVAGLADGAKNVLRVKSAYKSFKKETNLSVITEDGSYYSFNVKFAKEPLLLNIEMTDFLHDGEAVNRPNNAQEIYLEKLGSESPMLVKLIMKSIYKQNKREIKHIGSKRFGVQFLLKSIYANNGLLYFHTELKNTSNIPFDVDYVSFKIVDKKVIKRTAMQEQVLEPLRAQNYVTVVHGKQSERTVFALEKFTIPDDKQLVIEIAEKEGGRHQSFVVENEDIVRANVIDELSIQ